MLAATADSGEGQPLDELIGTADGINHAIPTHDELVSGLGALMAAGLIARTGDRYATTAAGRAVKRHWKGGLFGWSKTLLPQLAKIPRPARQFTLTEAETRDAYEKYVSCHGR